ncbi:MAG: DUF2384 domain-containing protein [Acidimicrobiia bacterium]|jgi:hypothetical protein|nr:DUF2384 domain-containing protein [Acidimicrobiia bacterium]
MNVDVLLDRYRTATEDTQRLIDHLLDHDADDRAWADQIGPVYAQQRVAELLAKTPQAVSADRRLLRLTMRSGPIGYPVWQFHGRRLLPGIAEVGAVLGPAAASSWTVASWLTSPQPSLDGVRPIDALHDGRVEAVVDEARRVAAAWAA